MRKAALRLCAGAVGYGEALHALLGGWGMALADAAVAALCFGKSSTARGHCLL